LLEEPPSPRRADPLQPSSTCSGATLLVGGRTCRLTVEPVATRDGRQRVYDLREGVYRESSPYLLHSRAGLHPAQDEFDGRALQFGALLDGELVAACRWVPRSAGRWEAGRADELPLEWLGERLGEQLGAPDELLQISRVVVRSDVRGRKVTEVLLRDACRWLLAHTEFRAYFALCLPALARFYVHFGATPLEGWEVRLAERAGNRYRLVCGTLAGSARAIDDHLSGAPERESRAVAPERAAASSNQVGTDA